MADLLAPCFRGFSLIIGHRACNALRNISPCSCNGGHLLLCVRTIFVCTSIFAHLLRYAIWQLFWRMAVRKESSDLFYSGLCNIMYY